MSELHRHLAHTLTEDRLQLARERQRHTAGSRPQERDATRWVVSTRHRRWMRRLRRAVLST